MRAVVFSRYGSSDVLTIEELDVPKIKSGQVLVKVDHAALNPKDVLVRKGKFRMFTGNRFPIQGGFEMSGVVEQSDTPDFKPSDEVFGMVNGWTGRCLAEYVAINEYEIAHKPANISHAEASSIPLVGQTVLQALRDIGNVKPNNTLLINGASGGVGSIAIQVAKILGANVTSVASAKNKAFCIDLGSDHFIDYAEVDILQMDQSFDIIMDAFGNNKFSSVRHLLKRRGCFITTVPSANIFKSMLLNAFRTQKSSLVNVKSKQKDLKWLASQIIEEKIKPVIQTVLPMEEIRQAHDLIETKRTRGKITLKVKK